MPLFSWNILKIMEKNDILSKKSRKIEIIRKKVLTFILIYDIIILVWEYLRNRRYSLERCIAQLGSAPALGAGGRRFKSYYTDHYRFCGSSSVGRASAFQAECREFDPRLPLHFIYKNNLVINIWWP